MCESWQAGCSTKVWTGWLGERVLRGKRKKVQVRSSRSSHRCINWTCASHHCSDISTGSMLARFAKDCALRLRHSVPAASRSSSLGYATGESRCTDGANQGLPRAVPSGGRMCCCCCSGRRPQVCQGPRVGEGGGFHGHCWHHRLRPGALHRLHSAAPAPPKPPTQPAAPARACLGLPGLALMPMVPLETMCTDLSAGGAGRPCVRGAARGGRHCHCGGAVWRGRVGQGAVARGRRAAGCMIA